MVERAKYQRPDLWIERGSAETLPHTDCSVDAVMTTLSFHHWSDKAAALREVFRVLRPGGLFALTDVSAEDVHIRLAPLWLLGRRVTHDMPTLRERERLIKEAGFQVLDSSPTLHRRWIPLTLAQRPGVQVLKSG
jgi:ubiquinone/menaquinone biosynthesis C-methylase UbiE